MEVSEKCSILFVFNIITKYFQYENFFFYLGPIPVSKTGLKEPVKTKVAVNLLIKKNFTESVVCETNPLYTKKNITYIVVKQYLDHEKNVFSDDIGAWVKSNHKIIINFGKLESLFEKIRI